MSLKELREEIDKIDKKIVELLDERLKICKEIDRIKSSMKLPIFDPRREKDVIEKAVSNAKLAPKNDVIAIFREIISMCRKAQKSIHIAYLGPEGSFTHEAAMIFGTSNEYIPCRRIAEVFRRVESEEADLGVVPFENSIEGPVNETLDSLMEYSLQITSEIVLRINQNLMVNPQINSLNQIERLYSHYQAIAQCEEYITNNLRHVEIITTESTAKAAKLVLNDVKGAAIGSKIAAELYGLKIISTSIEDSPNNYTRFIVLERNKKQITGDKTAIIFFLENIPGALFKVLSNFAKENINITMILSRPIFNKPWEYFFFMEFEGNISNEKYNNVLENVRRDTKFLKILGSYSRLA
ncbi:MAG: prephenate dehydratase [Candidatus Methanomethyliaceae archaeon]|nr:prephenate dehydratase [Candidatus Methanomethyliaceae archaeon]MDW7970562.1 prephenate dehydratase [Nitrososphaerota archaeon]